MRKILGMFMCGVVLLGSGCQVNGLNGLINGSKIDLSGVDVQALIEQLTTLLSTSPS